MSHQEAVALIGRCEVRGEEGSERSGGGAYSKGVWDNRVEEDLVAFGTIFEGANEEKLASATVFLLGLVANLTNLRVPKIMGLLIGTDD